MNSIAKPVAASGKRAKTKAANRQAILAAARQVFARIGFDATTVRDIIRETDLASGTFYNYFKSKEEVFEAIAGESAKRFRPKLQTVREEASSFEEYIRAAYAAYFTFLKAENEEAISNGAPHMALIGVRVDTPEMHAIFDEIRTDLEEVAKSANISLGDSEYLTASAIGIARELGDHMLQRRPVDLEGATRFATTLLLEGVKAIAARPN
ncbi:TetR/AcrR family transcriptional regulator [Henriciella aquimarina]|uniref:TetR/AcrR family transcriptional regulator n=1 Tax=Henriciella aquimarina TaxID=545261 RepID=UPI000A04EC83|nr:TetR/AcrR family transcriptional regulator [Henriciella aquimarina]